MEVSNGEAYYRGLLQKAAPEDQDYAGLDQGPEGTQARHTCAIDRLASDMDGGKVLDLGCGTGLLIPALVQAGVHPSLYVGTDLLPEREAAVVNRLKDAAMNGMFAARDLTMGPVSNATGYDVVLALGLMGPMPFNTLVSFLSLVSRMRVAGRRGLITLPMQRPEFLGCAVQVHFDMRDIRYALEREGGPNVYVEQTTYKEMAVWW